MSMMNMRNECRGDSYQRYFEEEASSLVIKRKKAGDDAVLESRFLVLTKIFRIK